LRGVPGEWRLYELEPQGDGGQAPDDVKWPGRTNNSNRPMLQAARRQPDHQAPGRSE
jgi:hypothetical protein